MYPDSIAAAKGSSEMLWVYGKPDARILEIWRAWEEHVLPITDLIRFHAQTCRRGMRNLTSRRKDKRFLKNDIVFLHRIMLFILFIYLFI